MDDMYDLYSFKAGEQYIIEKIKTKRDEALAKTCKHGKTYRILRDLVKELEND